jgi:hypothetical protein
MSKSYRVVEQELVSGEIRYSVQYNNGVVGEWLISSYRSNLQAAIDLIQQIKKYDLVREEVVHLD